MKNFEYAKNDGSIWLGDELVAIMQREDRKISDAHLFVHAAKNFNSMLAALRQVAFYASVNHGTHAKDYGEVVAHAIAKAEEKSDAK